MKAKFIGETSVAGRIKQRWECPVCREAKAPECRFNLSQKKQETKYKCRFCGTELLINKNKLKCVVTGSKNEV